MLDCQVAMLSYQASYHLNAGVVPGRQGRGHDSIPTYRAFTAGDGRDVLITANTEKMWQSLCHVLGIPELIDDPRFTLMGDRNKHRDVLIPMLEVAFTKRPAHEWIDALVKAEVPVAPVNDLGQVFTDPHIIHRGMIVELKGDEPGQKARVAGNPLKMGDAVRTEHDYPSPQGADGRTILHDVLKLDDAEIDRLAGAGAWLPRKPATI